MQAGIFRERRFWLSSLFALLILTLAFPSAAQDENFCRTEISQMMEIGDTLTGAITANVGVGFFCFEGERGDTVTVTVEVTDGRLIPVIWITDPVFDVSNPDEPLAYNEANREGGSAEVTFEIDASDTYLIVVLSLQNTLGTYEVSLDAEGRSILGETEEPTEQTDPNETEEPEATETEEPENNGSGGNGIDLSEIDPGDTNICRLDGVEDLEYGDSATGELNEDFPYAFYCFEGEAGDFVSLEVGTASGDIVMQVAIADKFFDFASAYAVGLGEEREDTIEIEFEVPEDGDYLIVINMLDGESGEFYLEFTGEGGLDFSCSNEPLSTLTSQQWMLASSDAESPLVTINLSCDGQVALSTMGAAEVGFYNISQDGELFFAFGNEVFTTVSLDAEGWTIANSQGTEYQFVPVPDTNCSEEAMAALINASWALDIGDGDIIFSFTCNGIFILSAPDQSFASTYVYEDDEISLHIEGQPLVFEDVVIEDDELSASFNGDDIELENVLAD